MKPVKKIKILSVFLCASLLTGCGSGKEKTASRTNQNSTNSVDSVLEQGMAKEDAKKTTEAVTETIIEAATEADTEAATDVTTEEVTEAATETPTDESAAMKETDVDCDLTVLSSTMVFSEVSNMIYHPEDYVNKTVRMKGNYKLYYDDTTEKYYNCCIIQDATACCSQGLEFVLKDYYAFPEDYPDTDDTITVSGVFQTYQENGYMYFTLNDAELEERIKAND